MTREGFPRAVRAVLRRYPVVRGFYHWVIYAFPYRLAGLRAHRIRLRPPVSVSFLPTRPYPLSAVHKICTVSGFRIQTHLRGDPDVVVRWQNTTFADDVPILTEAARHRPVVNVGCRDVSKRTLEAHHVASFGYGIAVDPLRETGLAVVKSNHNALHDGRIVTLPIDDPDPDAVYQRCVDNRFEQGLVEDIRLPIFAGSIPFAYRKYRPECSRFSNSNLWVELAETPDVLSPDETHRVLDFCRRLGLDYGELDALRDRGDGRLYVVDANNTPNGPPNGLTRADHWRAIGRLADAWVEAFVARQVSYGSAPARTPASRPASSAR